MGERGAWILGGWTAGARLALLRSSGLPLGMCGKVDEPFLQRGGALQAASDTRQDQREIVGAEVEWGEVGVVGGAPMEGCGEVLCRNR
jgi:hypothetical protein